VDLSALHDAARRSQWPEFAQRVVELARPSVELAVGVGVGVGFYGGPAHLPAAQPWPTRGAAPMSLLARLDCAAVAALLDDGAWTLPADGWLLFFHDDVSFDDAGCRVLHAPAGAPVREPPPGAWVWPEQPLHGVAAPSLPDLFADALAEYFRADPPRAIDAYRALDVDGARHRLLGWPDHGAEPAGRRPLLQLDAEAGTEWGEVVNVGFYLPDEDLAAGRLDRASRILEIA
jgi:hypothetical protein